MSTTKYLGGPGGTSCEELLRSNNNPYLVGQTFATYQVKGWEKTEIKEATLCNMLLGNIIEH